MGIFSIPPDLPVTKSKEEIDKTYRYWRMHLMITSYMLPNPRQQIYRQ